jgi:hypothetical protein
MQHIFILDYVLLPLYLALFYWRVKKMARKPEAAELRKYLFIAFWLRMLGSVAYCMLIEYYYGYGDSFKFYDGSNFFTEQISKNVRNISYLFASYKETADWYNSIVTYTRDSSGYFDLPSSNIIMRISAALSYLSFNKFLIIALFFGFFSFAGQWKLFLVFDDINKHRHRKLLAFAVLYSPSIWFWGSGLLKDSLCLGSLGFIIYILYELFVKKRFSLFRLIQILVSLYMLAIIKSYILAVVLVGFAVMFFSLVLKSIANRILRFFVLGATVIGIAALLNVIDFSPYINTMMEESITQIRKFQQSYQAVQETDETSKAGFDLGEIDPSLPSLLAKSPQAIFTCLFRPFLWESRKVIILFTSLESTLLLFCTLFVMLKLRFIHFFRLTFNTPHLLFCFVISMLFALIIGFTTFNFGTMIRYKIIFLPFYYFFLVNLYCKYLASKKSISKVGGSNPIA